MEINVVFAPAATSDGTVTIHYTLNNAVYGTDEDFTTLPSGESGIITLPFSDGDTQATITVNKLQNPIEGDTKSVNFSIDSVSLTNGSISGNVDMELSFTETAALGAVITPEIGGVNYTNSAYIDLSSQTTTLVRRDAWELAFNSGAENRVYLNSSLRVTAAELTQFTDLNAVNSSTSFSPALEFNVTNPFTGQVDDVTVNTVEAYKAGVKQSYSMYDAYADYRDGSETAISIISGTDEDNKVYLVYMGSEIPTEAGTGSTNYSGDDRGWYKIRVLMESGNYKLQYADLDATTFKEVTINKDTNYNVVNFSLSAESIVSAEPEKNNWDIIYAGVFGAENGPTYTDYVLHNTLGGTGLYQVTTYEIVDGETTNFDVPSYEEFALSDVEEASLDYTNRNIVGSGWRNPFIPPVAIINDDRYYIIKDSAGNYYKLRFNKVVNEDGERGNPCLLYTSPSPRDA